MGGENKPPVCVQLSLWQCAACLGYLCLFRHLSVSKWGLGILRSSLRGPSLKSPSPETLRDEILERNLIIVTTINIIIIVTAITIIIIVTTVTQVKLKGGIRVKGGIITALRISTSPLK